MAERPRTQFLDLKSSDFGPKQEDPGARIENLKKPPPTELIQTHPERVREEADVLAEVGATQKSLPERSRRMARIARLFWDRTVDTARRLAQSAQGSLGGERTVSHAVTVAEDASLSSRPSDDSAEVAALAAGTRVVIYPEIEGPPGWVAVRSPRHELGWLRTTQIGEA